MRNADLSKVASLVPVPCDVIMRHVDPIIARIDAAEAAAHEAAIDYILERSGEKNARLMTKTDDRNEAIAAYNETCRCNFFWEDWIGKKEPSMFGNDGNVVKDRDEAQSAYRMYGRYPGNPFSHGFGMESRMGWDSGRSRTAQRFQEDISPLRILKQKAENALRLDLVEVHVDRKLYDEMLSLAQRYAVKVETPAG